MAKSLLILTGHSQGLGRAILDTYLQKGGFEILAISRTCLGLDFPQLKEISLDLSELDKLEKVLETLFPKGDFEEIHLINNAGWIGEIKPVGKLKPSNLNKLMNINLLAPICLTNAFVAVYQNQNSKRIVCNISSGAAHKPVSGWSEYCSSKAALAMFSMVCEKENEHTGIRFFSLAPGIVDTAMQNQIRSVDEKDFPDLDRFKNYKSQGALSSAKAVSQKISYLMSNSEKFEGVIQDVRDFDLP
jgi:benzil reductase ((S)-benzoin forming)